MTADDLPTKDRSSDDLAARAQTDDPSPVEDVSPAKAQEAENSARRRLLKAAIYSPPVIVGTIALTLAGCQTASCGPSACDPENPCGPTGCDPAGPCGPDDACGPGL